MPHNIGIEALRKERAPEISSTGLPGKISTTSTENTLQEQITKIDYKLDTILELLNTNKAKLPNTKENENATSE